MTLILLFFVSNCIGGPGRSDEEIVSADLVRTIERQVIMPRRAQPLPAYDRYYSVATSHGRMRVVGTFALHSEWGAELTGAPVSGVAGAYRGVVRIDDGGCSVVTIVYDLHLRRFLRLAEGGFVDRNGSELASCNGEA